MKNLFAIPDTLDTDERRYRQVLKVFLWILFFSNLLWMAVLLIPEEQILESPDSSPLLVPLFLGLFLVILLYINSRNLLTVKITGVMFLAALVYILSFADDPYHMAEGRSLLIWAIPIIISAAILPWWGVFIATAFSMVAVSVLTLIIPNPYPNPFTLIILTVVGFTAWVVSSIQNRSIRDTRIESANRRAVLQSISDGVVVYDRLGSIISTNPAILQMMSPESLQDLVTSEFQGETYEMGGKVFSVIRSSVPDLGTVAIIRDETRRREIERAKDSMMATVSHELRTPLASIMGYAELLRQMLKMGMVDPIKIDEMAGRMLVNAARLKALVSDLLDRAQIEAGAIKIKSEPFSVHKLLENIDFLMRGLATEKELELTLDVGEIPTQVVGDHDRLHQVMVNLVGNAVKFTDPGGKVLVRVSQDASTLVIDVEDTGAGIPAEQIPDIFEPFRRGSNYATRRHQGAGLGLSISKQLITLMGGSISVRSRVGEGTAFRVTLPLITSEVSK